MNKEQIFKDIKEWQGRYDESFFDQFEMNINSREFMFWAVAKNYITIEQFQSFEKAARVYNYLIGDEEFSLLQEDNADDYDNIYDKANEILAEFISTSIYYQNLVEDFLSDKRLIQIKEVLERMKNGYPTFFIENNERVYVKKDDKYSIEELFSKQWYADLSGLF